jgi:sphingomyelin phosphodiesterase
MVGQADDKDVCTGAVGLEGPIIAQDLRAMSIPSHTSQLFCITFFGLCPYPPVTPYTVPFPSPKPPASRPTVSGQPPIQVVHFSDIHIDPFYETGASYNCTKPICCRPYTSAEAPGNNHYPAGPYGNTKCDAPVSLEDSMYAAIKQIAPNAAFTLFTGDIVDHAVWLTNQTQNIKDINDAYTRMSGLPPVYGVVGNHNPRLPTHSHQRLSTITQNNGSMTPYLKIGVSGLGLHLRWWPINLVLIP